MKTFAYYSLLILVFLSACTNLTGTRTTVNPASNIPLSEFIRGRWQGVKQTNDFYGTYVKTYHLDFINEKSLKLAMVSPYDGFNEEFQYQFIGPNTLTVENARTKGGEWQISRSNENLLICIWSNQDCVIFARDVSDQASWFQWAFGLLIAILIALLTIRYIRRRSNRTRATLQQMDIAK